MAPESPGRRCGHRRFRILMMLFVFDVILVSGQSIADDLPPPAVYNKFDTLHIGLTKFKTGQFLVGYRNMGSFAWGTLSWGIWNVGDLLSYPLGESKNMFFNLAATRWVRLAAFTHSLWDNYVIVVWVDDADFSGNCLTIRYNNETDYVQNGDWILNVVNQAGTRLASQYAPTGRIKNTEVKAIYENYAAISWARNSENYSINKGEVKIVRLKENWVDGILADTTVEQGSNTGVFHDGWCNNIVMDTYEVGTRHYIILAFSDVDDSYGKLTNCWHDSDSTTKATKGWDNIECAATTSTQALRVYPHVWAPQGVTHLAIRNMGKERFLLSYFDPNDGVAGKSYVVKMSINFNGTSSVSMIGNLTYGAHLSSISDGNSTSRILSDQTFVESLSGESRTALVEEMASELAPSAITLGTSPTVRQDGRQDGTSPTATRQGVRDLIATESNAETPEYQTVSEPATEVGASPRDESNYAPLLTRVYGLDPKTLEWTLDDNLVNLVEEIRVEKYYIFNGKEVILDTLGTSENYVNALRLDKERERLNAATSSATPSIHSIGMDDVIESQIRSLRQRPLLDNYSQDDRNEKIALEAEEQNRVQNEERYRQLTAIPTKPLSFITGLGYLLYDWISYRTVIVKFSEDIGAVMQEVRRTTPVYGSTELSMGMVSYALIDRSHTNTQVFVQGQNYFCDGAAGYLMGTDMPTQPVAGVVNAAPVVDGYVICYRTSGGTGACVYMGIGWQKHPEPPKPATDIWDRQIYIQLITRGTLRVLCQTGFPQFVLENLNNADNIPGFWDNWRWAKARNILGWTLYELEHNTTHTLYCITEDGILSRPYNFQTYESCLLPLNTVGGVDPICGPDHVPPYMLYWDDTCRATCKYPQKPQIRDIICERGTTVPSYVLCSDETKPIVVYTSFGGIQEATTTTTTTTTTPGFNDPIPTVFVRQTPQMRIDKKARLKDGSFYMVIYFSEDIRLVNDGEGATQGIYDINDNAAVQLYDNRKNVIATQTDEHPQKVYWRTHNALNVNETRLIYDEYFLVRAIQEDPKPEPEVGELGFSNDTHSDSPINTESDANAALTKTYVRSYLRKRTNLTDEMIEYGYDSIEIEDRRYSNPDGLDIREYIRDNPEREDLILIKSYTDPVTLIKNDDLKTSHHLPSWVLPHFLNISFEGLIPDMEYRVHIPNDLVMDKADLEPFILDQTTGQTTTRGEAFMTRPNFFEGLDIVFETMPSEQCDNGVDDDMNGFSDCNDLACSTNVNCLSSCGFTVNTPDCNMVGCGVTLKANAWVEVQNMTETILYDREFDWIPVNNKLRSNPPTNSNSYWAGITVGYFLDAIHQYVPRWYAESVLNYYEECVSTGGVCPETNDTETSGIQSGSSLRTSIFDSKSPSLDIVTVTTKFEKLGAHYLAVIDLNKWLLDTYDPNRDGNHYPTELKFYRPSGYFCEECLGPALCATCLPDRRLVRSCPRVILTFTMVNIAYEEVIPSQALQQLWPAAALNRDMFREYVEARTRKVITRYTDGLVPEYKMIFRYVAGSTQVIVHIFCESQEQMNIVETKLGVGKSYQMDQEIAASISESNARFYSLQGVTKNFDIVVRNLDYVAGDMVLPKVTTPDYVGEGRRMILTFSERVTVNNVSGNSYDIGASPVADMGRLVEFPVDIFYVDPMGDPSASNGATAASTTDTPSSSSSDSSTSSSSSSSSDTLPAITTLPKLDLLTIWDNRLKIVDSWADLTNDPEKISLDYLVQHFTKNFTATAAEIMLNLGAQISSSSSSPFMGGNNTSSSWNATNNPSSNPATFIVPDFFVRCEETRNPDEADRAPFSLQSQGSGEATTYSLLYSEPNNEYTPNKKKLTVYACDFYMGVKTSDQTTSNGGVGLHALNQLKIFPPLGSKIEMTIPESSYKDMSDNFINRKALSTEIAADCYQISQCTKLNSTVVSLRHGDKCEIACPVGQSPDPDPAICWNGKLLAFCMKTCPFLEILEYVEANPRFDFVREHSVLAIYTNWDRPKTRQEFLTNLKQNGVKWDEVQAAILESELLLNAGLIDPKAGLVDVYSGVDSVTPDSGPAYTSPSNYPQDGNGLLNGGLYGYNFVKVITDWYKSANETGDLNLSSGSCVITDSLLAAFVKSETVDSGHSGGNNATTSANPFPPGLEKGVTPELITFLNITNGTNVVGKHLECSNAILASILTVSHNQMGYSDVIGEQSLMPEVVVGYGTFTTRKPPVVVNITQLMASKAADVKHKTTYGLSCNKNFVAAVEGSLDPPSEVQCVNGAWIGPWSTGHYPCGPPDCKKFEDPQFKITGKLLWPLSIMQVQCAPTHVVASVEATTFMACGKNGQFVGKVPICNPCSPGFAPDAQQQRACVSVCNTNTQVWNGTSCKTCTGFQVPFDFFTCADCPVDSVLKIIYDTLGQPERLCEKCPEGFVTPKPNSQCVQTLNCTFPDDFCNRDLGAFSFWIPPEEQVSAIVEDRNVQYNLAMELAHAGDGTPIDFLDVTTKAPLVNFIDGTVSTTTNPYIPVIGRRASDWDIDVGVDESHGNSESQGVGKWHTELRQSRFPPMPAMVQPAMEIHSNGDSEKNTESSMPKKPLDSIVDVMSKHATLSRKSTSSSENSSKITKRKSDPLKVVPYGTCSKELGRCSTMQQGREDRLLQAAHDPSSPLMILVAGESCANSCPKNLYGNPGIYTCSARNVKQLSSLTEEDEVVSRACYFCPLQGFVPDDPTRYFCIPIMSTDITTIIPVEVAENRNMSVAKRDWKLQDILNDTISFSLIPIEKMVQIDELFGMIGDDKIDMSNIDSLEGAIPQNPKNSDHTPNAALTKTDLERLTILRYRSGPTTTTTTSTYVSQIAPKTAGSVTLSPVYSPGALKTQPTETTVAADYRGLNLTITEGDIAPLEQLYDPSKTKLQMKKLYTTLIDQFPQQIRLGYRIVAARCLDGTSPHYETKSYCVPCMGPFVGTGGKCDIECTNGFVPNELTRTTCSCPPGTYFLAYSDTFKFTKYMRDSISKNPEKTPLMDQFHDSLDSCVHCPRNLLTNVTAECPGRFSLPTAKPGYWLYDRMKTADGLITGYSTKELSEPDTKGDKLGIPKEANILGPDIRTGYSQGKSLKILGERKTDIYRQELLFDGPRFAHVRCWRSGVCVGQNQCHEVYAGTECKICKRRRGWRPWFDQILEYFAPTDGVYDTVGHNETDHISITGKEDGFSYEDTVVTTGTEATRGVRIENKPLSCGRCSSHYSNYGISKETGEFDPWYLLQLGFVTPILGLFTLMFLYVNLKLGGEAAASEALHNERVRQKTGAKIQEDLNARNRYQAQQQSHTYFSDAVPPPYGSQPSMETESIGTGDEIRYSEGSHERGAPSVSMSVAGRVSAAATRQSSSVTSDSSEIDLEMQSNATKGIPIVKSGSPSRKGGSPYSEQSRSAKAECSPEAESECSSSQYATKISPTTETEPEITHEDDTCREGQHRMSDSEAPDRAKPLNIGVRNTLEDSSGKKKKKRKSCCAYDQMLYAIRCCMPLRIESTSGGNPTSTGAGGKPSPRHAASSFAAGKTPAIKPVNGNPTGPARNPFADVIDGDDENDDGDSRWKRNLRAKFRPVNLIDKVREEEEHKRDEEEQDIYNHKKLKFFLLIHFFHCCVCLPGPIDNSFNRWHHSTASNMGTTDDSSKILIDVTNYGKWSGVAKDLEFPDVTLTKNNHAGLIDEMAKAHVIYRHNKRQLIGLERLLSVKKGSSSFPSGAKGAISARRERRMKEKERRRDLGKQWVQWKAISSAPPLGGENSNVSVKLRGQKARRLEERSLNEFTPSGGNKVSVGEVVSPPQKNFNEQEITIANNATNNAKPANVTSADVKYPSQFGALYYVMDYPFPVFHCSHIFHRAGFAVLLPFALFAPYLFYMIRFTETSFSRIYIALLKLFFCIWPLQVLHLFETDIYSSTDWKIATGVLNLTQDEVKNEWSRFSYFMCEDFLRVMLLIMYAYLLVFPLFRISDRYMNELQERYIVVYLADHPMSMMTEADRENLAQRWKETLLYEFFIDHVYREDLFYVLGGKYLKSIFGEGGYKGDGAIANPYGGSGREDDSESRSYYKICWYYEFWHGFRVFLCIFLNKIVLVHLVPMYSALAQLIILFYNLFFILFYQPYKLEQGNRWEAGMIVFFMAVNLYLVFGEVRLPRSNLWYDDYVYAGEITKEDVVLAMILCLSTISPIFLYKAFVHFEIVEEAEVRVLSEEEKQKELLAVEDRVWDHSDGDDYYGAAIEGGDGDRDGGRHQPSAATRFVNKLFIRDQWRKWKSKEVTEVTLAGKSDFAWGIMGAGVTNMSQKSREAARNAQWGAAARQAAAAQRVGPYGGGADWDDSTSEIAHHNPARHDPDPSSVVSNVGGNASTVGAARTESKVLQELSPRPTEMDIAPDCSASRNSAASAFAPKPMPTSTARRIDVESIPEEDLPDRPGNTMNISGTAQNLPSDEAVAAAVNRLRTSQRESEVKEKKKKTWIGGLVGGGSKKKKEAEEAKHDYKMDFKFAKTNANLGGESSDGAAGGVAFSSGQDIRTSQRTDPAPSRNNFTSDVAPEEGSGTKKGGWFSKKKKEEPEANPYAW